MGVEQQSEPLQTEEADVPASSINFLEDEVVIESVRPAIWNWWKWLLVSIAASVFAVEALGQGHIDIGIGAFGIATLLSVYPYAACHRSRYIVTNERVKRTVGVLSVGSEDMRIADIRGISTEVTLADRTLRTGTVTIRSIGGDTAIVFKKSRTYERLAHAIRTQQQKIENQIMPE